MSGEMQKILVIDDDESLRDTIGVMLEKETFLPILAADGKSGFEKVLKLEPELLLLDLKLPGMSGVEVCKQLRVQKVQTPIIVLSAAGEEIDKVVLLEMGADDYIVKPFGMRELAARIRALLRRSVAATRVLYFEEVAIDLDRRNITRNGREINLRPTEYKLLVHFLQNPDRALTREALLDLVWGYESYPNSRTVDAHVARLRQKLEPDPNIPRHFVTVHGIGYRFLQQGS
jgi:DNA-binding response OmpR family regulator